jgi:hypothetical protein
MADTTGTRASQIKSIDRHGNGTKVQMSDGTGTSGHLAVFDANGNVTDGGATSSLVPAFVRETPAGTLDGSNATFTLSYTPSPAASLVIYLNGVEQDQTRWCSVSGTTITFTVAPKAADKIIAQYTH